MRTYKLRPDNAPVIEFYGHSLATVSDGSQMIGLFETPADTLICHRTTAADLFREQGSTEAIVCEDHSQVVAFFGTSKPALELYELAGIEY